VAVEGYPLNGQARYPLLVPMSDTVFIFGAGASAEAGAPVMSNFLDVARDLYLSGRLDEPTAVDFARVFKGVAALNDVYAKAAIDTDNIEAVFAAFEMAQLFGKLPRVTNEDDIRALIASLRRLIVETLERSLSFPVTTPNATPPGIEPPSAYKRMVTALCAPGAVDVSQHTFITFNYDLALDYALRWHDISVDYGLASEQRTQGKPLLLKLHGSVNWTACSNCGVGVYHLDKALTQPRASGAPFEIAAGRASLRVARQLRTFVHCNSSHCGTGEALLVPPTWSKAEHHRTIARVWRHAARELETARNVIIVGYSLPDADAFFRYLYALGTVSDTRIERFWVVDCDPSDRFRERFRSLLGPTALARFEVFPHRFDTAMSDSLYGRGTQEQLNQHARLREFLRRGAV
jgi:hypothetical protein